MINIFKFIKIILNIINHYYNLSNFYIINYDLVFILKLKTFYYFLYPN